MSQSPNAHSDLHSCWVRISRQVAQRHAVPAPHCDRWALRDAEPDDKAEIFRQLGLKLTYPG